MKTEGTPSAEMERLLKEFSDHVDCSDFEDFEIYEHSLFLRNGDVVVDVEDNNMHVYEQCRDDGDDQCSCHEDATSYLSRTLKFIHWSFINSAKLLSYIRLLQSEHASLKEAHKKIANVKNWQRVPSEFITVETLAGISQEVLSHTKL